MLEHRVAARVPASFQPTAFRYSPETAKMPVCRIGKCYLPEIARMAELADALDSKSMIGLTNDSYLSSMCASQRHKTSITGIHRVNIAAMVGFIYARRREIPACRHHVSYRSVS